VLPSRLEGGANVLSEAIVASVPVLASRIPGSIGILGDEYPGYFPAGDTRALADLLRRIETDRTFLRELGRRCELRAPLFKPAAEKEAWANLLAEFGCP
jgi:glycosyltransferase involved in cell wall biosynthesis